MDVRLPQLSEGANSGTVLTIFVQEGDSIEKDQTILELENDKAVAPIPSPVEGKIQKIHVFVGDEISTGAKIATIVEEGRPEAESKPGADEQASKQKKTDDKEQASQLKTEKEVTRTERAGYQSESGFPPPASPSVRRLAKQIGLDLSLVPGSKRGGRIIVSDIQSYIANLQSAASKPAGKHETAETAEQIQYNFEQWGPTRREPYSSIRKTVGLRMQKAWTTIPHVYQFDEADITALMETREHYKAVYTKNNTKLTLTAIAVKAVIEALKQYPIFNASLDLNTDEIVYKDHYHIGIAVDSEAGLFLPVIRDADKKTLLDIAKEITHLAEKARDRKLTSEEMKGGAFAISNLGGIGGSHFTPIINEPNAAILGMGRSLIRPVLQEGEWREHTFLPICVSYDHRLIDGADGARFAQALVKSFEQFETKYFQTGQKK